MNAVKHYCIFIIDFDRLGTGGHRQIKGLVLFKASNPKPWEPNNPQRDMLWYNKNIPALTRADLNPTGHPDTIEAPNFVVTPAG